MCKQKGNPLPQIDINLPPGALEVAAKDANVDLSEAEFSELYEEAFESFKKYICSDKGIRDMMLFQQKYNTHPNFSFHVPYLKNSKEASVDN